MSTFKPSTYQTAIYNEVVNGNGNILVNAVAGSGKSTTILNCIPLIPKGKTVLFLAFNKAIVEELKLRVGDNKDVTVSTLHSLGMRRFISSYKTRVNDRKYTKYVYDGIKYGSIKPSFDLTTTEVNEYRSNILKMIDLGRAYLSKNVNDLQIVARKYAINLIDNELDTVINCLFWGINNTNEIDFSDMVYMPTAKRLAMNKFDYIFVDEAQDLNAAQRMLVLNSLDVDGRFIAVGDPKQAIYGFAGADIESFNLLTKIPNTVELPLSVCYRCDRKIVELAKTIVPQIEARADASEGIVCYDSLTTDVEPNDMILCRLTAPLVGLCMNYISKGIKAYVKGQDIGINLINLIKGTNMLKIKEMMDSLYKDLDKLAKKIARMNNCSMSEAKTENVYTNFQDKLNAINILSSGLNSSTELCNRIKSIFADDKQGICLSTIHKSKGLEANNVYIICKELLM